LRTCEVEHPFRVVKQQFGYAKLRYRGLAKNTARLTFTFVRLLTPYLTELNSAF
jgi:IS5 family transposase